MMTMTTSGAGARRQLATELAPVGVGAQGVASLPAIIGGLPAAVGTFSTQALFETGNECFNRDVLSLMALLLCIDWSHNKSTHIVQTIVCKSDVDV